jgi:hypothetical protein
MPFTLATQCKRRSNTYYPYKKWNLFTRVIEREDEKSIRRVARDILHVPFSWWEVYRMRFTAVQTVFLLGLYTFTKSRASIWYWVCTDNSLSVRVISPSLFTTLPRSNHCVYNCICSDLWAQLMLFSPIHRLHFWRKWMNVSNGICHQVSCDTHALCC